MPGIDDDRLAEAIFLSTFVLVSQNRQAAIAERRTELELQINLLTEYEVPRVLTLAACTTSAGGLHVAAGRDESANWLHWRDILGDITFSTGGQR